jgi:hypothetical protein
MTQQGQEPANTGEEAPQPDRLELDDLSPQQGEAGALKGGQCKGQSTCKGTPSPPRVQS